MAPAEKQAEKQAVLVVSYCGTAGSLYFYLTDDFRSSILLGIATVIYILLRG